MKINQIIPENIVIDPQELAVLQNKDYTVDVFDKRVIRFFDVLSKQILKNRQINQDTGLTALGFWLRKANVEAIISENNHLSVSVKYKLSPLGIVFHICPANVDTMFLYSLAISLLTGNKNILRISLKTENTGISLLFDMINEILASGEFSILKNYLNIIRYEHDEEVSTYLSLNADARIIWGGDNTVKTFKKFPTKSRTKDIFFPDRTSYSIFKAKAFLNLDIDQKKDVARKFYNDSYIFDQKGCSSPQIIFIYGEDKECETFKAEIYELLMHYASNNYQNDISSLASLKLNHLVNDVFNNGLQIQDIQRENNYVYFVEIDGFSNDISSCGGGYFYIKKINQLLELSEFCGKEAQTISYFGLTADECYEIGKISFGKGIDRIVPIGEALAFEYIWDGFNLIDELCLKKRIKTF
jgi:hypothetical protein